jgi:hypothetical protein
MDQSEKERVEKALVLSSGAAAVLCFLPWFSMSASGEAGETLVGLAQMSGQASANAFGNTSGILAFLAAVATVGMVIGDRSGSLPWERKTGLVAPLVSSAVGVLCMFVFMGSVKSFEGLGISGGRTFWFYLALVAMIVAGWNAFRRWQDGMAGQQPSSTDAAES